MPPSPIATAAAVAFAGLALAAPALAEAHDYYRHYEDACTDRIHDNGVAGALLGGAAGAVLGSNLASHGGRTGGAVLGGVAGAAIGSNIARSSTKDACRGPRVVYHYAPPPPPPVYVAPRPVYVVPPPPPAYGYEVDDYGPHDRGLHRGWYKHHRHDDDDDD